jgi:dienelactone hydrolase
MKRTLFVVAAIAAAFSAAGDAPALPGPVDLSGSLGGANYAIKVPASWNGTLVVLAHGYRDKADHPGEIDETAALDAGFAGIAAGLNSQGYAVAATSYSDNGWAVKEAVHDLTALTSYFRDAVGVPESTLLVGFSLGSLPTLELAERGGGLFDGFLPACAVAAGAPRAWDGALVELLAYDVAFGMPAAWGTPADVDDDVDFDTEVLPTIVGQLLNPINFARFEFMRLVGRIPLSPGYYPGGLLTNAFFLLEARAELERRARGPIAQNLTHTYTLGSSDRAYLNAIGMSTAAIDSLLAAMNARRTISAPPSARNYVEHYASFTGKLKHPVLTLHTVVDTLVPVQHESAYAETVAAAGSDDLLRQTYTSGTSHCGFSFAQIATAVQALDAWARTGLAPTPATFPAALGFVPGFVPAPWTQP